MDFTYAVHSRSASESHTLWNAELEYKTDIPLVRDDIKAIAVKYNFPRFKYTGRDEEFIRAGSVPIVWTNAHRQLRDAYDFLAANQK